MNDRTSPVLRTLRASDVEGALRLSVEAGWNQTADDWAMLINLAPNSCLGIEVDGELVSTCTLFCYGSRLAWVGMVLTRISRRGRGFARRLLTHALTLADQMGIETVKLDATDQGQPLYEKLGFRSEQPVERWGRDGQLGDPLAMPPSAQTASANWKSKDARAFGTDRSKLLDALARRRPPLSDASSYVLTRPGRLTNFLGPSVADSPSDARTLIERALQQASRGGWIWDVFPKNTDAISMARDLGFAPQRHLMRMARGKDLRTQEGSIFALAGFELG